MLESITRRSTLSTRNTGVAFGEDEIYTFFEACLHKGDQDDNEVPVNQVAFINFEAFIEGIKKHLIAPLKKKKT